MSLDWCFACSQTQLSFTCCSQGFLAISTEVFLLQMPWKRQTEAEWSYVLPFLMQNLPQLFVLSKILNCSGQEVNGYSLANFWAQNSCQCYLLWVIAIKSFNSHASVVLGNNCQCLVFFWDALSKPNPHLFRLNELLFSSHNCLNSTLNLTLLCCE